MRLQKWAAAGALLCAALSAVFPACEARDGKEDPAGATKSSGAALSVQMPAGTDVAGFSVLVTRVSCNGEPFEAYAKTYPSALLDLDISIKVTADGSSHPFADTFIPLEAGCYDIVSIPVKSDGSPSEDCAIAGADGVVVLDGLPTEVALVSQCNGQVEVGAIDVISTLNRPPQVTNLTYPGGKLVAHCDDQQLCATFKDPDGDPLEVVWTKKAGLPSSTFIVGMPSVAADGSVTQCITIDHAGPEMMLVEARAYDLLKNPSEPGHIRFEQLYADNGIPATSNDSFLFQAYGALSDTCPCTPHAEVCDGVDNDCDGQSDDGLAGCACTPIAQVPCYDGPPGTEGQGACNGGVKVCAPDGSGFGACIGQVTPVAETCPDGKDNDCNGVLDDCCVPGAGTACAVPGGVGACAIGYTECDGTCTPPDVVLPETCNGIDDDCNGVVDDLPPVVSICFAGVGACQTAGALVCSGGAIACTAVPAPPAPQETCNNGIDDDCNGVVDDCAPCAPNAGAPCSVPGAQGACAPGHVTCAGTCAPDSAPQAEVCNGVDDDCDGQTDEGLSGGSCSVGIGACQATGQQVCMAGGFVCDAVQGQPSAEVCGNAIDENCDGVAEPCGGNCAPNMGQACAVPNQVGPCAAGVVQCDGTCLSIAQPSAEQCDGVDNDCDGSIDEGVTGGTCSAGTGACFAAGTFVCAGGVFACDVMPGAPQPEIPCNGIDEDCNGADSCPPPCVPSPEVCDGADNDCDGLVDEGLFGGACAAGLGACAAAGQQVCVGGAYVCDAVPGQPSAEVCNNGADDDCDGVVDEGCGDPCAPNMGQACFAPGQLGACAAGVVQCDGSCQPVVSPSVEVCNGVDDDCDGQVDEGLANGSCSAGLGACLSAGQLVCSGGGYVCDAVPGLPQAEICGNAVDEDCNGVVEACVCNPYPEECDGIDNDCDGEVDEGLTGGTCSVGLGACAATGQQACQGGVFVCGAVPGQPTQETCNAVDDDCDGQVDEGLVNGSCTAGAGACLSAGQLVCSGGGYVCDAVPGLPQPEIQCNGIDEDCNGVDECSPACDPCTLCNYGYDPGGTAYGLCETKCQPLGGGTQAWCNYYYFDASGTACSKSPSDTELVTCN